MSDPGQKVVNKYKIVVAGSANTGKTCFIRRHLTGEFAEDCQPTPRAVSLTLTFVTTRGQIVFELWDVPGVEKAPAIWDHFSGARGVLAFYDASASKDSISEALAIVNATPKLVAVLCGGKADLLEENVALGAWSSPPSLAHYQVSAKNDLNIDKPFLVLARAFLGDPLLTFIEKPAVAPAATLAARLPVSPEAAKRVFLVVSEQSFGAGLRGIFDTLDAARAYAKYANIGGLGFAIISFLPNVPGSELFVGNE